jgi:putative hydrolase of the HAD superfamily
MTTKAVFLDALGTLVELEPPWVQLAEELGVEADDSLVAAFRAEMAYYRDHAHEGADDASLADLRQRCADLLGRELGREVSVEQLMAAIRFRAFQESAPALSDLRRRGLTLVCVSNWDISLAGVLERAGLGELLDGVVTSAAVGARKPEPAIFAAALEIAGCEAAETLHVGDTPAEDVAGARTAGIRPMLLDRDGGGDISSLTEIAGNLDP